MEKTIEIPLGAKDSELKGWEYTIPEGYVARIDGNKIILEPKESDDERIRKALISILKSDFEKDTTIYDISVSDIIAWLEKQGEQKVPVLDFKAKDWYVSKVDGKIHNIYHSVDKVEPKFKVGDVIRNKWSNRTKTIIAIDDYQYTIDDGMPAQPFKVNINEQDNWELIEENPAWSEEDSPYYDDICEILINLLHSETADVNKDAIQKDLEWLLSLENRYTWKPSDEQMKILQYLCETSSHPNEEVIPTLESLYNDLKKLKG